MMDARRVAVIGAGNVGSAVAGDLTLAGHEVSLYEMPQFKENLVPFLQHGGVELSGVVQTGFARLNKITTEMTEAIRGAQIIAVVTTALAHETIAELCAPDLEDGQIVVLFTGNLSSLLFAKILKERGANRRIRIAETQTAPFSCRRPPGEAKVDVTALQKMYLAALPATDTKGVFDDVKDLFSGRFFPARNVLEVFMNNPNPYTHVPTAVLNTGWIESTGGAFAFYTQGTSPSVLNVSEAVCRERTAICKVLGLTEYQPFDREARKRRLTSPATMALTGPTSMRDRFIVEDCPICLVAIASLGDVVGIPTPVCKALITLASEINRTDYFKEGRNGERLGISGLSIHELLKLVDKGHL